MPKRQRPDKSKIKADAEAAFKKQETKYKAISVKDREFKLLNDLQKKGTLSDKVSALMVKVQKSYIPDKFVDFASLDSLMVIAKKKSRHHSYAAIEGLQELFMENLLPNSPLQYINDLEVKKIPGGLSKLHFEDKLKRKYTEFVNILKSHTIDTVDYFKKSAIKTLAVLAKKPEMQDYILECLVNKLGDPNHSIPTFLILECNHLVWKNKSMMEPMLKEISRFVSKPGLSSSAKFYAIVLMNSFKLTANDQVCLQLLISILLRLFPIVLRETKVYGNRAVTLLLKALNKNFPLFSNKSAYQSFFKEEIDEIYKLTHLANSNIQIEALRFIFQSEQGQGFVSDRYYRALYEFVQPGLSLRSVTYKSLALFFNTFMMSLKEDVSISRVKAFVKRLLQVCLVSEPHFVLASLMLLSEICKIHKSLWQMTQVPSDDEEEVYQDAPDSDEESGPKPALKIPEKRQSLYDPCKREPKFSGSESTALFELVALAHSQHPTIRKWANCIIQHESIEYEGDPLLDFSLINFLDRFEYRNPKKSLLNKLQGKKVRMSLVQETVNSKEFREKEEETVREDEMFFYKYFKLRPEIQAKAEEEEEGSEEENGFDEEGMEFDDEEFYENFEEDFNIDEESGEKPKKKLKKSVFVDADEYYS